MPFIIYKAVNTSNNKIYIGMTKNTLSKRKSSHKQASKKGKKLTYFSKAINKYGFDKFEWFIIDGAIQETDACAKEKYWIKIYNSTDPNFGYNLTSGGKYFQHNIITKKKISEETIKAMNNPEVFEKLSKINSGANNPFYGKKRSTKERNLLSKKKGGKVFEVCCKITGKKIGEWQSRGKCAEELNLHRENILSCLKGRHKSSRGYTFKYKDNIIT